MLLNCHTYYSYKFGSLSVDELIEEVIANQYESVALTDINNTSASLQFIRTCLNHNIKPVLGIDFRNGVQQQYVGIAQNNTGFQQLNEHLTHHLHDNEKFSEYAPDFSDAFIIYPFDTNVPEDLRENEFIGIRPAQVNRLAFSKWKKHSHKMVILQAVSFRHKRDFNIHRLLRAIDKNVLLSRLPKSEEASPDEIMLDKKNLLEVFSDYPELIENTQKLMDRCSIHFDFTTPKNKQTFTGSKEKDFELLVSESKKGLNYRYKNPSKEVIERMERELQVIKQLDFCSYFLINWDLIQHARKSGSYYVGRGSGANSMVAYLLRITDVDPIELDLYFERFINPFRKSPPDFDIDFASRDRNRMTRYLFDQYGWNHTALVGTYITFQYRSMIREIGKVFGLPADEIESLQKARNLENIDEMGMLVLRYSKLIHGFPSHLSVHASGIIISEEPISKYTATMMPPKGFPTIHFSMLEAEDIHFSKFDILGQRGLSKIEDALSFIEINKRDHIDIHDLEQFKKDSKVQELLKQGKTVGCFYVESPAMRMLLTKLEADDYIRLVAASSIIRPGVAKSGMMREYILRYRDQKRREAARKEMPVLYDLLKETYGVMVYQEDVIKVAHYFAGLTLAEADVLRRGMSWKYRERGQFHEVKDKFFQNCKEKDYPLGIVQSIWTQIESFANYAFSKGHSASYAVESFQALYLKAHYPLEYLVATINNGGGFYRKELYVHEAKMHGAKIELPCVNQSDSHTMINGNHVILGLSELKDIETGLIKLIIKERLAHGPYSDLRDFMKRVPVSLEQLTILIRINAFRFTGKEKKELLWDAHFILKKDKRTNPSQTLFDEKPKEFKLPELYSDPLETAYNEIELIGFPVSVSPFELLSEYPDTQLVSKDLKHKINQLVEIVGYLVHVKRTQASGGKRMSFGVFIDTEGHWIDTVHFPAILQRYPFRGPGCYHIKGKVVEEFGFVSIEVSELDRLPNVNIDGPSTRLRKHSN